MHRARKDLSGALTTIVGADTAYIKSRGQWHDLNDSKIGKITEPQVASANKSAYTLWYSLSPASQAAYSNRIVEVK